MSQETIALIVAIVGSSTAAVWAIRSKMSEVESKIEKLMTEFALKYELLTRTDDKLEQRVVKLETTSARRRK
jgi:hypothetical protein